MSTGGDSGTGKGTRTGTGTGTGTSTSTETSKKKLIRRYLQFVKPYWHYLAAIVALGMLQYVVPLSSPWLTKILIDDVLGQSDSGWTLKKVVVIFASIYAMSVVVSFFKSLLTARLGSQMVAFVRRQVYEHIQKMSQRFYDNQQVGGLLSRVIHDVNGAQNLVGNTVINVLFDLVMVIFAAFFLFSLNWHLALLSLWLLPIYYLSFTNLNIRIRYASRAVNRQMERISGVLVERISGMKVVQSFNGEHTELERFDKQTGRHINHSLAAQLLSNLLGRISEIVGHSGTLITWAVGGAFVLNGEMSIGSLIAFQAFLGQMYGPIQRFADVNVTVQNAMTNIERIFELLDVEPDVRNKDNALPLKSCQGDIRFKNVSFTYETELPAPRTDTVHNDPDLVELQKPDRSFYWYPPKTNPTVLPTTVESRTALESISFHAKPGQVVALVGPSGAGKSTLINFIPRFYDADQGTLYLDGRDIKEYDLHDLRKQIAVVLQDNILFSGTVYDNIVYGRPEASMDEVMEAAKAANAHDFIMKWEKGYSTVLGERGLRLSGGQKQRLAIARALLKDPKILILDEATSALDAESEAVVTEALDNLMKNRTTFIIAHRLATVVRADIILVMDNGHIAEHGTHEQLLQKGGLYRELYEKQLKAMRPEGLEIAEVAAASATASAAAAQAQQPAPVTV
ncbi:MAG: multidrug transporter ATP-binding protein [Paenibacillus sp.]|uniref:ABC transporter ATP-binding protein n=1 Tax=Paenibacillus sp. GCM10012303 TaxID=3317340 RepID=UPI0029F0784B|nr:multidrug transporter ATP-binding protein [Paenibacillus sp.]